MDRPKDQDTTAGKSVQRRLAAILAADVAGYTKLVEQDTTATVAAWQAARDDVIDPTVAGNGGRIVKLTGDGFLAEFPIVEAAVACAISLQEQLRSNPLRFRLGVSIGDIVDDGRDIHGEGINIAARLESLAEPGGILISGDVFNLVRNRIRETFTDLGQQTVKHVSQPVRVFSLQRFSSGAQVGAPPLDPVPPRTGRFSRTHLLLGAVAVAIVVGIGLLALPRDGRTPRNVVSHADEKAGAGTTSPTGPAEKSLNAANRTLSPGDTFRDCAVCPMMTVVPSGSFKMGSEKGDPDEKPVHEVTLPRAFAMATYETTFEQWDTCVADKACGGYRPEDQGWGRGNRPAINVSWLDAQAYIGWLRERTGKTYRLPTEAEWEYAARGGSVELYPWGFTIDAGKANYGLFRNKTMPVGDYDPNGFGLYDVVGNVWEWTADCYDKNAYAEYHGYPDAFLENNDTCRRVVRGGSWNTDTSDGPNLMRTSIRWRGKSNGRYDHYGFRVVRELE